MDCEKLTETVTTTLTSVGSLFTSHPNSTNTRCGQSTYLAHLGKSCNYAFQAASSAVIFVLHGLFPFVFEEIGPKMIINLNLALCDRSSRN